ncbi:hypothetical protein ACP1IL_004508, partial [Klebsiella pneumoniae]
DDKGRDARKRAYCLKIQPATGSFARNLIYSTKPIHAHTHRASNTLISHTFLSFLPVFIFPLKFHYPSCILTMLFNNMERAVTQP